MKEKLRFIVSKRRDKCYLKKPYGDPPTCQKNGCLKHRSYMNIVLTFNYNLTHKFTADGKAYSFGDGSNGQLGHGTMVISADTPQQITTVSDTFSYANCGVNHSAIISSKCYGRAILSVKMNSYNFQLV